MCQLRKEAASRNFMYLSYRVGWYMQRQVQCRCPTLFVHLVLSSFITWTTWICAIATSCQENHSNACLVPAAKVTQRNLDEEKFRKSECFLQGILFFFHLQGLISKTPDCNSAVLENVLDWHAFYGMLSYASFNDIVKLLKNLAAFTQTAPAHAHCFGCQNTFFFFFLWATLTPFSLYSPCNSFIFGFVTVEIYMTFTIILGSCSRLSTMYVQMYKAGENVTWSAEHLCALPGELLAYDAKESRTEPSAFHTA